GGEEGGGDRGRPQGGGRAAPEGAMAARFRGGRELDGFPRAAGDGANPGRVHRPGATGTDRGRPRREEEVGAHPQRGRAAAADIISAPRKEAPWPRTPRTRSTSSSPTRAPRSRRRAFPPGSPRFAITWRS